MFEQLGLIGCGLMGGSFALACKRAGLVKSVVGYSKSPTTTQRARQMGVIDVEAPSALLAVSGADLVLMAVPVAATEDTFKAIRHLLTPQTLLMDVGSTKSDVVQSAERVLGAQAACFVPAHPIAGKEVAGVEHADPDLYRERQVILTPTERTASGHADRAEALWRALGCQVLRMAPQAHDAAYAAVSHLPHLLAFAFMNGLASQADAQRFLELAGPGFRDFTRIAASDENVWRDILLTNRDEVLRQSRHFRAALAELEHSLEDQRADVLVPLIRQAAALRRPWQLAATKPFDD